MEDLALPVGPRDHVRGDRDAPVTVVEYADVECPYCASTEPLLRELLETRPDVQLVYRHFPLVDVHPYAYGGALALEAAAPAGLLLRAARSSGCCCGWPPWSRGSTRRSPAWRWACC